LRYAFLLAPLVALAGCAPQPPQIVKSLPPPAFETWAPQEFATNVQDWDRVATKVADKLQAGGLLRSPTTVNLVADQPHPRVLVKYEPNSIASREVADAIYSEIVSRGGLATELQVDLAVSIVPWGSCRGDRAWICSPTPPVVRAFGTLRCGLAEPARW
jgi:hypothetical protein